MFELCSIGIGMMMTSEISQNEKNADPNSHQHHHHLRRRHTRAYIYTYRNSIILYNHAHFSIITTYILTHEAQKNNNNIHSINVIHVNPFSGGPPKKKKT